ncbi:MAG: hypothetical protein KTR27_16990 [Leptolyngbyaceae cyanobacterium MAG.088]|nr:hypothetical protein [Leptolyngbyaceae cyanobacterium MAG.088]
MGLLLHHHSRRLGLRLFIGGLLLTTGALPSQAQDCPYATLRLEISQSVNSDNICQAAKPWADEGYQVLVFLTDAQPASQDDWYALLDQVEADAGLRNLSLLDSFKRNGLSLAAQTKTTKNEVSVTYGEILYDTPIDTSPKFDAIKQNIRVKLGRGNAEEALVYGLQDMYLLNHAPGITPPTVSSTESSSEFSQSTPQPAISSQPVAQAPVSSPTVYQEPSGSQGVPTDELGWLGLGSLGLAVWQYRRQRKFKKQCQQLQASITTLLMACNDLLEDGGKGAKGTVLYSLFEVVGGRLYPALEQQVTDWLTQARQALDQAFIVQDDLQQQQPKWFRSNYVQAWEELYLNVLGQDLFDEELSNEALYVALDPMRTLDTYRLGNQLVAPLKKMQERLTVAPSLWVNPIFGDVRSRASLGILGTLQRVKAEIARLRKAEVDAPQQLTAMRTERQTIASTFPAGLQLSADQALQGIDNLLDAANVALKKKRFLDTLSHCESAEQGLQWLATYGDEIAAHRLHQNDIQAVLDEGFRPPQQDHHKAALVACLEAGQQPIAAGDYASIPDHLVEFKRLDEAALYHAQQWQHLCYDNRQKIEIFKDEVTQLQTDCTGDAERTWRTLQTYPVENWQMVETCLPKAREIASTVDQEDLPQAAHLNCLNVQLLNDANDRLDIAENNLTLAKQQLAQLRQQAELVETLSMMLPNLIERLNGYIKVVNKLGKNGVMRLFSGMEPRLKQALERLPEAASPIQQQCYMSALEIHDGAGRTALTVYREKLDAIAPQVNSLINSRDANNHGRSEYDAAFQCMPSPTDIVQASGEEIHKHYADFNRAWELLKSARHAAEAEIRRERASRRSSSSSRSRSSSRSSSSSSHRSSRSSSRSRRSSSSGSSRRSSSSRSHGSSRRR